MPRSLADGHIKFTILTAAPAIPATPTAAELNAGIDAECNIMSSDFQWTATDSDKVAEKALCVVNNANALGPSNFAAGFTVFRYFNSGTGAPDATEDAVFAALDTKGTEVWGYARNSGKLSTVDWATGDIIYLGGRFLTDEPQLPSDRGGYIKFRVPCEMQEAWTNQAVIAGA